MTGFVFLRVRAHRLLLTAALLAVLLTTAVLATLASFSGSIGDAGLRHSLRHRDAASAALLIQAAVPTEKREAADRAVQDRARQVFDGLPVTLRKLERSGPYALPRGLQPPAARKGEPDLTLLAALDRSRVRLTQGTWPAPDVGGGAVEVALPEAAARQLKLKPGGPALTLADRLGGPPVRVRVTGVYRPTDRADPYWQLDDLGGRGIRTAVFTTYGPLLADPALLASDGITEGEVSWLATADFSTVTADRIGPLREAASTAQKTLGAHEAFASGVVAKTSLPSVLDQAARAMLVSRSTLLILSLQLVLLAAYALLLVARLLSAERAGETALLLARGGSRRRVLVLTAVEAVLLAAPAGVCAPLLAGPLTRFLAGQGSLSRIGLHLDTAATVDIWLVGASVAVGCAAAVVAPALGAGRAARGRASALPAPLRAGADVGLLVIAAVAYWQLDRQTASTGALSGDRAGRLGVDPLLVTAPALTLLAGTVLTLRLLPPLARLAERRAAGGRGLPAALAGWQFSRRPLRGAGPVLLLVLATAMGMLAIGQGASWDRSQDDQADFRAGTAIRVQSSRTAEFGQGGSFDGMPGVRSVAPAARTSLPLSGDRSATVLSLDTRRAEAGLLLREDLADSGPARLTAALRPEKETRAGILLPADAQGLRISLTLAPTTGTSTATGTVSVMLEDRYGLPHRMPAGTLRADGLGHTLTLDLARAAGAPAGKPAGPLEVTGLDVDVPQPFERSETHRLTVDALDALTASAADRNGGRGTDPAIGGPGDAPRRLPVPAGLAWTGRTTTNHEALFGTSGPPIVLRPVARSSAPLDVTYATGRSVLSPDDEYAVALTTVSVRVARPKAPLPAALATDRFLRSSGAEVGSRVEIQLAGEAVQVEIAGTLRRLPTTGPGTDPTVRSAGPETDGGGLLLDLSAVNRLLGEQAGASLPATEWWLSTGPGAAGSVAAQLRERPDIDPAQVLVRDEIAAELYDDPLGAGPQSALLAVAVVAAALAAVGFAVGAAGSLRERSAELAVLRALGTPPRQLARLMAAEHSLLIGLALVVGVVLGAVLTRAVVPLTVLTGQATQPVPSVLVELPAGRVAALLAGVVALPLLVVAAIALRRGDTAATLRVQGGGH
ncbi:FtsX-like permease family protein [Streptomyces sp. NPDC051219]|uniref:FtsX-like permease family protein n=1 Tax=Streptomyces sp. NPDC051219 TaxID=3155283 RepID=UPI003433AAC3